MKSVTAMAKEFTPVRLEEIVSYLKRAFRALRPHPGPMADNELTFDLSLSDNVVIRIFTSAHRGQELAAGLGEDAIRIGMYSAKSGRYLKSGKLPTVQRTQKWRDNLRRRIENELEEYDDREGYWEFRATGVPTPYGS